MCVFVRASRSTGTHVGIHGKPLYVLFYFIFTREREANPKHKDHARLELLFVSNNQRILTFSDKQHYKNPKNNWIGT